MVLLNTHEIASLLATTAPTIEVLIAARILQALRITSYNVCYTKLLRTARPNVRMPLSTFAEENSTK